MGFRNGAYAKVWEVKPGAGNYTDARISISKKDKKKDEYVTDFSGYVRLIGTAHTNASSLKEGDNIQIGECEATQTYNKEKKATYTNFAIFSFEKQGAKNGGTSEQKKAEEKFMNVSDAIDDDELPFN